ncbi:hypothetical protein CLV63_10862 [Murinocardiopsis flavida]|uniref:DivIVA domain-containing protein n=1 Tax=Murinocardiopsis flavida TaxID=645275 RepID=A0A2P8DJH0_9ACTN|nr:hypothetical protein [Murinocardiopsis flavida]PSK97344.1 hypothetical protein CLV63_10862 [Murinocardiopsis flavida]
MNLTILILTGLAAVAVLAAVALVVMGKGGQLARFEADHAPLDLPADRPISAADVAGVRLPLSMWGYHVRAVDEALRRLSGALRDRDARIEELEARLGGLAAYSAPAGAAPGQSPLPFEEADSAHGGPRPAAPGPGGAADAPTGRHAVVRHDDSAAGTAAETAADAPDTSSLHVGNGRA